MSLNTIIYPNSLSNHNIKPSHSTSSIKHYTSQIVKRNARSFNRSPSYSSTLPPQPSISSFLPIPNSIDIPSIHPPSTSLETVSKELDTLDRKRKFHQKLSLLSSNSSHHIIPRPKSLNIHTNDYTYMINNFGKGRERSIQKELLHLKNSLITSPTSQKLIYNPPIAFTMYNRNHNRFYNKVNMCYGKGNDVVEYVKNYSPCQREIIRNKSGMFNKRNYIIDNGRRTSENGIVVCGKERKCVKYGMDVLKRKELNKGKDIRRIRKDDKDSVEMFFNELNKRNKSLKELLGLYKG